MTESGFAVQLAEDLGPEDLRLVLEVFRNDVDRLLGVLDASVAAGDVAAFRRTCHGLAGAAGAVGAVELEKVCRAYMNRPDLAAGQLQVVQGELRALGSAALGETASVLAGLPGA